jgi:CcmD family protein
MGNFVETNSMYVVLIISVVIWIGVIGYLYTLNKKVRSLNSKKSES